MNAFCFVGLDIGHYNIAVYIIDEAENKLANFTIKQTHQHYQQLIDKLLQLKADGLIPIVSSEGHDGNLAPLDEYLLDEEILFKPLHPTAVNRYKDILGARHKTDDYDAYVIADFLRSQHAKIPAHQKHSAEFKNLSRTYKAFSKTKTQFTNQLRCELMSYFPELVTDPICSTVTSKTCLHLLVEYPTPEHVRNSSVEELTAFIGKHSKNRLGRQTAEKLMHLAESVHRYPSHLDSKALVVQTLAQQILTLAQNLSRLEKQLKTLAEESLEIQRIASIPGASVITAARLLGEVCNMNRFKTEAKLAMYVGLSPVSDDSGKRKGFHRTTHRANKVAKDAIIQIAESNRRYCAASASYYHKKREAGLSHWQAVKCLARQLIRVIFALFRDDTFYCHQNSNAT